MKQKMDVRYLFVLLGCVVFCIGCFLFYQFGGSSNQNDLFELQARVDELNQQIVDQREANNLKDTVVIYETTGIDGTKVNSDMQAIDLLCDEIFTWYSYADYVLDRNLLLTEYTVDPESEFMQSFFPEVPEILEDDGTSRNDIDENNINCSYEGCEVYLNNMFDNSYSYIVFVDFSSRSVNDYESVSTACLFCTVDSVGNIFDLSAYVAY